ncbi:MAG: TIGR03032 family protein [Pirellula sp.]|nr:TIGR03032 family protein [Pirellula sp.]
MPMSFRRLATPTIAAARPIELRPRGDFVEWLAATGGTLAVTTYNSGKLALLSAPAGELVASCWSFPRPMGLAVAGRRLALASRDHFWQMEICGGEEAAEVVGQQLIVPAIVVSTGRLDAHDVAFDRCGVLFANTRFNCVARPSERVHFIRVWRPSFMGETPPTLAVDCCHLNGIGVRAGRLEIATAFCEQSEPAAWRAIDRFQSGVLIDVLHDRVAARGLCLPHSPRWHAGGWWLCDSGRGALARFDPRREVCEPVIELPGFTRGLTFVGNRAVVGLSRIRKRHILDAPPVRERWPRLRSGLAIVDQTRGVETGSLEFVRGGREVYDVAFIAGVTAATFADPTAR